MRSQLLIVLLAAAVSARPMPPPHNVVNVARELEYSKIAGLSPPPTVGHGDRPYIERDHEHPPHLPEERHRHGPPPSFFDERVPQTHPHDFHDYPHDHKHGGSHRDIVDNIVEFFSHEARSVPEVSSRVVDGIIEFFSPETWRDVHEHEHPSRDEHPENIVISKILDFFASNTR